jgi:hypothetical protein
MPYVTSIGTYVPCRMGVRLVPARLVTTARGRETDPLVSGDCRRGAQISLVHNVFRPTALSGVTAAATTGEGATHGAW